MRKLSNCFAIILALALAAVAQPPPSSTPTPATMAITATTNAVLVGASTNLFAHNTNLFYQTALALGITGGGGGSGGIPTLNGAGTNTTLVNPTLNGTFAGNVAIPTNNLPANLAALAQNNGVQLTGFTASQIPGLDASNIISGTFNTNRLPGSLPALSLNNGGGLTNLSELHLVGPPITVISNAAAGTAMVVIASQQGTNSDFFTAPLMVIASSNSDHAMNIQNTGSNQFSTINFVSDAAASFAIGTGNSHADRYSNVNILEDNGPGGGYGTYFANGTAPNGAQSGSILGGAQGGTRNFIWTDAVGRNSNSLNITTTITTNGILSNNAVATSDLFVNGPTLLNQGPDASPASAYVLNIGQAVSCVYLSGTTTFILATNTGVMTNLTGNNNALFSDLYIYSGLASNVIAFTNTNNVNLIWESEFGTETSPTGIASNTVMHVRALLNVTGTVTNCVLNYKIASYSPIVDPDAQSLFTAIVGAGGSVSGAEKAAYNRLVVNMKAHGTWALCDCLYPFIGGSSNSCSWNGINTNKYRIAWTLGSSTFSSTGWLSDGSTSFGNTQFTPSTASSPNYVQNSASIAVYNGTASPTFSSVSYFIGATSGARFGFGQHNSSNFGIDGQNNNNGEGVSNQNPSPFNGLSMATIISGPTYSFYTPTGTNTSGVTTTGVPNVPFYIGGRNNAGFASPCAISYRFVLIGGGFTSAQYASLSQDVTAFETALGRQ